MQAIDSETYLKKNGITSLAISPNGELVAVSLKSDPIIQIFRIKDKKNPGSIKNWQSIKKLKEHIMQISEVTWSSTNHLLSCSFDQSVNIWKIENDESFMMIPVNIIRPCSFLTACWTDSGNQFALGGSDHIAYVGYYEPWNQFWNMCEIRGQKSSVIAVQFHPSGRVIGIGSADLSISLVTSYVARQQDRPVDTQDYSYKGIFDNVKTISQILFKITDVGGWVENIAFSPNGKQFAFSVHNSTIRIGNLEGQAPLVSDKVYYSQSLPYKKIHFKNNDEMIAIGYEGDPHILKVGDKSLAFLKEFKDVLIGATEMTKSQIGMTVDQLSGQQSTNADEDKKHQVTAHTLRVLPKFPNYVVCTADANGNIFFWNLD